MKLLYIIPSIQTANLDIQGVPESKTMLSLANGVVAKLAGAPFKVMISKQPTLTLQVREANRLKADLVVHLHSDAGGGRGATVFYDPLKPATRVLAVSMDKSIATTLGIPVRGAKDGRADGLLAIKGAASGVNSILAEGWFHDDKQDVYESQVHFRNLCNEIAWQLKVCLGVK